MIHLPSWSGELLHRWFRASTIGRQSIAIERFRAHDELFRQLVPPN